MVKDKLVMAAILVAIVAVTGGWDCALGWTAEKFIGRVFM
jgi:hypothetical protein